MIIVITHEDLISHEIDTINEMFRAGLDLLHIRKPFINDEEMKVLINGIDQTFHPKLVLHSHYEVGKLYNISRFHVREADRVNGLYRSKIEEANIISTSVHQINDYNMLGNEWQYSFISPVFPSISKKGYGQDTKMMEDLPYRNNIYVKLIALGGIDENTLKKVFHTGADGAALLGAIWNSSTPINTFKKCRDIVLS
ncbi:thiamine phosphate synthase [Chryseobacterium soli]|uniref:thiamine phosphate synthase n=1 Tax=Chryseobacterium soli TaxID=445961 RepID=UPI002952EBB3|nr:thiamine phosphate synthase [Chryseobacterium soli]MDV7696411.1 thiamine phosphate synthase [Chryseobacterium soli]